METMIGLGFFTTEGELIEVTSPLVLLLNGCTDYYSEAEEQAHAEQIEELGDASIPLRKTPEEHRTRYKCDTEENATIVKIKCKIVDICSRLLDFQNNARLTSFLIQFGRLDKQDKYNINSYCKIVYRTMSAFNPSKKDLQELSAMSDVR